jgi:hypothetical protein
MYYSEMERGLSFPEITIFNLIVDCHNEKAGNLTIWLIAKETPEGAPMLLR